MDADAVVAEQRVPQPEDQNALWHCNERRFNPDRQRIAHPSHP
jgi:hypothetical protein